MRLKLKYITKQKGLLLPLHYNSILQALIYKTFSKELAASLHDEGFTLNNRHFKLFNFSRILNRGRKVSGDNLKTLKQQVGINEDFYFISKRNAAIEEALYFENSIEFYFSSPKDILIEDIGNKAITTQKGTLLGQDIFIASIEVMPEPKFSNKMNIKMISPMTVYSTMKTKEGRSKTYYYSPYEKEFSKLVQRNAQKKYQLITGNVSSGTLKITPLYFTEKRNRTVVYFKNTRIEGWTGVFVLEGDVNLIKVTYEAGLGSKNPEGFGMWKIYTKRV